MGTSHTVGNEREVILAGAIARAVTLHVVMEIQVYWKCSASEKAFGKEVDGITSREDVGPYLWVGE